MGFQALCKLKTIQSVDLSHSVRVKVVLDTLVCDDLLLDLSGKELLTCVHASMQGVPAVLVLSKVLEIVLASTWSTFSTKILKVV